MAVLADYICILISPVYCKPVFHSQSPMQIPIFRPVWMIARLYGFAYPFLILYAWQPLVSVRIALVCRRRCGRPPGAGAAKAPAALLSEKAVRSRAFTARSLLTDCGRRRHGCPGGPFPIFCGGVRALQAAMLPAHRLWPCFRPPNQAPVQRGRPRLF